MQPERDDPLLRALGGLPVHDVAPARAMEIRTLAHAALCHRPAPHPWLSRLDRTYTRVLEPALVSGATAVCLGWALFSVIALLGAR